MKVTITAESSLTISQCGKTVNIVKGDSFVLYGKVFAYKGIIIDVTKYLYVFSVKTEPGLPPIPTYEFIDNVTIAQNGKVARFTKGQQFKTVSDVVWIADIVLDLTVYAYALTVVSETPVPPTVDYEVTSSSANVTLSDIQENQTIDVETDTVPKYTITITNENVIVTPSIPSEGLTVGSTVNGTITPKPGFKLLTAKIGSAVLTVSDNEAVITDFIMPAENVSIECVTEAIEYEITANGENFAASPTLPATVAHGANFTTLITPTSEFKLTNVQAGSKVIDVGDGTSCTVDLTNVTEDTVITIVTSPATRALDDEVQLP